MKRALLSMAILAVMLQPHQVAWAGDLAALQILDRDTGEALKIWRYQGKNYVVGQPNQRYTLQLRNKLGGRLLAVMAVDGVNIITGATASAQQSGYVLDPYEQRQYDGWRKSESEVAAFYFTSLGDSYADRTGRGNQVGVIGVALFREKINYYTPHGSLHSRKKSFDSADTREGNSAAERKMSEADAAGSQAAPAVGAMAPSAPPPNEVRAKRDYSQNSSRNEKLGTGHGERLSSYSTETTFNRASQEPAEMLTVYYDSYRNLVARGIIPRHTPSTSGEPEPFPSRYVPDPR